MMMTVMALMTMVKIMMTAAMVMKKTMATTTTKMIDTTTIQVKVKEAKQKAAIIRCHRKSRDLRKVQVDNNTNHE